LNNIYYTYIYLDPRKKGLFVYDNYIFDYQPFYVGMGKNQRILYHIFEAKQNNIKIGNRHKYYKIRKILKEGLNPIHFKISINLSKKEACELEIKLIKLIGRNDLKEGPLVNLTDGGEGSSGFIVTPELKLKLSKIQKEIWKNNYQLKEKAKQRNIGKKYSPEINQLKGKKGKLHPHYGKHFSQNIKDKMSESHKGQIAWNKGKKRCQIAWNKGKKLSDETRLKIRETHIKLNTLKENTYRSKYYNIIFPNGEKKLIYNMAQFCRDNNLDGTAMSMVARGIQKYHKGFKVEKIITKK